MPSLTQFPVLAIPVFALVFGSIAAPISAAPATAPDPTPLAQLVDPLAGTDGGSLVPGPVAPYGLVWLSPDRPFPQFANGYDSRSPILGFSHTHVSGTGGGAGYGNIRVTPQTGPLRLPPRPSPKSAETAHAGYYAVTLHDPGVRAELTAEPRVGHHRYTFAPGAPARLLIDVASTLARSEKARDEVSVCRASTVRIVSDRRIEGSASFLGGVWSGGPYDVFFAAEFDQPFTRAGVWRDDKPLPDDKNAAGKRVGAYAEFTAPPKGVVGLRVGLSFKNLANARTALAATAPDFDAARAAAEKTWSRTLSVIAIEGATDAQRLLFFTALYRCFTMPTDLTGDNPRWDSTAPHYWHYFAVWDTFRSLNPLLTLVAPERQRDLLRSLLDTYDHTGWLPDAWISGNHGRIQGGNNAHVLFADAFVKKLPGIDYAKAYAAMKKYAETPLPPTRVRTQGRHDVGGYARRGYLPDTVRNSGSVSLEYAYNDYCISVLARGLGHDADAARYLARSRFAFNLFNPDTKSFWTRDDAGKWTPGFLPDFKGQPIWEGPFYEGTPREYGSYVPHDMAGLVKRYGGPTGFVAYLDELFDGGHFHLHNEPLFLVPYAYNYAARPDRTAERVRRLVDTAFRLQPDGWPGQDDSGAMSSWYVWSALGLFPVAGQDVYLIGTPTFARSTIRLGGSSNAKTFTIRAENLSPENKYVQSATLNGRPLGQCWFRHVDLISGGELLLRMGPKPSTWATDAPPPPSPAHAS